MASITAAGTGSGLDIETIIETLVEAERMPTDTRLDTREIQIEAEITAFGSMKSAVSDFQSAMSGLSSLKELAARSASSTNEETFTATASSGAAVGTTDIQVTQLASNHKLVSNANFTSTSDEVGTGDITLSLGGVGFTINVISGENSSLLGIRDAINDNTENPGITASILTVSDGAGGTVSKLVLTADETGEDNNITVSVSGDSDGNDTDDSGLSAFAFAGEGQPGSSMIQKSPAQNAELLLDGEFVVTSNTNQFSDAIEGVTITALKADTENTETMTIALDQTAITERLNEFVEAFNTLSDTLAFLTDYDVDTGEAGLLTGDFVARTIETQLRRAVSDVVEDATSGFNSLASIGITTQRDGSIALDESKLNTALANNFDDVAELLAGEEGIVKRLDDKIDTFLRSDGAISSRTKTFQTQLDDIDEQRIRLDRRIASFEERIRAQYTNLDILVGQLQSTGDFVTQQLDIIKAGLTGKK